MGDPTRGTAITLETLDVQACQYGGTYPFCKLAPDPSAPSPPGSEPAGPDGTSPGSTGGTTTAPPDTTAPDTACNSQDPVLNDPRVQDQMQVLWDGSNYSPTTPQTDRLEQYAWVVSSGTGYALQPMNIPPAPCGLSGPVTVIKPPGAIAFIHTHPWKLGERQTSCPGVVIGGRTFHTTYKGQPSSDDAAAAATLAVPGYIMDADGLTIFDGQGSVLARHGRCGY